MATYSIPIATTERQERALAFNLERAKGTLGDQAPKDVAAFLLSWVEHHARTLINDIERDYLIELGDHTDKEQESERIAMQTEGYYLERCLPGESPLEAEGRILAERERAHQLKVANAHGLERIPS